MQTDVWMPLNQAAETNGRTTQEFLERVKLGKISSRRSIRSLGKTRYWGSDAAQDKLGATDAEKTHGKL